MCLVEEAVRPLLSNCLGLWMHEIYMCFLTAGFLGQPDLGAVEWGRNRPVCRFCPWDDIPFYIISFNHKSSLFSALVKLTDHLFLSLQIHQTIQKQQLEKVTRLRLVQQLFYVSFGFGFLIISIHSFLWTYPAIASKIMLVLIKFPFQIPKWTEC